MNGVGKTSVIEGLANALGAFKLGVVDRRNKPDLKGLVEEVDHRREWVPDLRGFNTHSDLAVDVSAMWDDIEVSWQLTSHSPIAEQRQAHPRLQWLKGKKQIKSTVDSAERDNNKVLPLLIALQAGRLSRGENKPLPSFGELATAPLERLEVWSPKHYFDKKWYELRTEWANLEQQRTVGDRGGERAKAASESIASALRDALELQEDPWFSPEDADFIVHLPDDGPRPVGLMSDGWRTYVTIVAGLAMHCAKMNPYRSNAAKETPGILLIDELEQHLHPHLQLEIVDGLRAAFPLLQIIATTHSPLILTDAVGNAGNSIIRLDRSDNGEIVPETLRAPEGQNVLQVLTGDWFGLSTTYDDETLRMLAQHRELLRGGPEKREEARKLAAELRDRLGRYANTSVEEMVLSIVAELEQDTRFDKLTHEQIRDLRAKVIGKIKADLT